MKISFFLGILQLCSFICIESAAFLNQCQKQESEFQPIRDLYNGRELKVLPHLSVEKRAFIVSLQPFELSCSCSSSEKVVSLSLKNDETLPPKTNRTDQPHSTLTNKLSPAFYKDGRFRFHMKYYNTDEYCITKITQEEVQVRVCTSKCEESFKNPCIRKCCDANQILNNEYSWNPTYNYTPQCETTRFSRVKKWYPTFYTTVDTAKGLAYVHNSYANIQNSKENFRLEKTVLPCENPVKIRSSAVGKVQEDSRILIKMLRDGKVYYFHGEDKVWKNLGALGTFCIDGLVQSYNDFYDGDELDQMVLLCPETVNFETSYNMSGVYGGAYYFSSIFLLLMVGIYFLLLGKQSLHVLSVFSYACTMFLLYIFKGTLHYLNSRRQSDDEALETASWECYILAIAVHYLHLSTFSWLTVMNFDILRTFWSVNPVGSKTNGSLYKHYAICGWILPLCITIIFIILDAGASSTSNMTLPAFGTDKCFMNQDALGPFLFYVLAIFLAFNIILIAMTFWCFYKLKQSTSHINKSNDKFTLWKIFLRLFLVMGVAWIFEVLSWIYVSTEYKWYWSVIDVLVILQAVAVFAVYTCNENIASQLEAKYPEAMRHIRKLWCCWKSESTPKEESTALVRGSVKGRVFDHTRYH